MADLKALGIMSGTSLDGVDFVKIKIQKKNLKCQYVDMQSFDFPKNLRRQLLIAAQNEMKISELSNLNHDLGRFYAMCFKDLKWSLRMADVIGLHGQTVYHEGRRSTLQIGEPSYLALTSKKQVVSNFRAADIAAGGEGAPLAPLFHEAVFGQKNKCVSLHNLGGISNLSLINNGKLISGFDTGPANMLIDEEIRIATKGKKNFDKDGAIAASGKTNIPLLGEMLKYDYFNSLPPKSCGREQFGKDFHLRFQSQLQGLTLPDRLATLTELTVQTVVRAYIHFCKPYPVEIIFSGGGVRNKFFMKRIEDELTNVKIKSVEQLGWPSQSIEGAAFALLAACRVWKIPANRPQVTGASKAVLLGQITQF